MRIDANLVEGILCAKIRHDEERHLPQAVGRCEIHLNLRDRASIRSRLNHGDYLGSGRIEDSHEFGSKIPNAGNAFIASVRRIHGARHVLLALALGLVLGNSIGALMFILGISTVPTYARIMRGQVMSIRNADYIMAENVIGAKANRITLRHILPNCFSPMIVLITQNIGNTILSEATLSFVGLGVNPPTASWGGMVNDGYIYLLSNPVYALAPGICIMLLVFGFNVLGDGLRDVLDPRLRGTLVK